MLNSLRLAFGLLTALPVRRRPTVDPRSAGAAIALAPLTTLPTVGLLALAHLAVAAGAPPVLTAALVVTAATLYTRAMHLDGLADTADGLGCFGPPERALAVMRDGAAGPFAVVTLVVVIGTQAAALAALPIGPTAVLAVALACATGRAGFAWCARRRVPAARPGGLGATVAGSQPAWVAPLYWLVLGAAGVFAVPGRAWGGPVAVGVAALAVVALAAHTRRRLGGMTGDVLGAASEIGTTAALVVLASG